MTDILLKDVPNAVIEKLDAIAESVGMSRNEYILTILAKAVRRNPEPITMDDLRRFSKLFQDLKDPEIMKKAWK